MNYKSFAVTVIGGSHIKSGLCCQDASNYYNDKNMSVAVVADGHGDSSCFRSDSGSKFAVACATEGIKIFVNEHKDLFKKSLLGKDKELPSKKDFEELIREKLIKQIVASWNKAVMENYNSRPFTKEELDKTSDKYRERYEDKEGKYNGKYISKAYGTSLIAAVITDDYWFGFHIGDGRFTVLYQDGRGDQPISWDEKCYLNVTTSICDDDILDREDGVRIALSFNAESPPPIVFFLCSDGIDDNYPVEGNEEYLYRLYREIAVTFADDGYDSTCGKDGTSGQIKDLANQFATKGKGDDTSLAGIINIEAMKKVAPAWKENIKKDEVERALKKAEKEKAEEEARIREEEKAAEKAERKVQRETEQEAFSKEDVIRDITDRDTEKATEGTEEADLNSYGSFEAKNASDEYKKVISNGGK